MRTLLVEDDGLLAFMVQDTLVGQGHEVVGPAASVDAALRLAVREAPDFALVDIDLRGTRTGVELVRELAQYHGIPSVYLTGQEAVALANAEFALGLVLKPVAPDDLLRIVDWLRQCEGQAPRPLILFDDPVARLKAIRG